VKYVRQSRLPGSTGRNRALADTGIFDGVTDAGDGREKRVDGDHANGLIRFLFSSPGKKTATDLHFQLHLELALLSSVQMC